MAKVNGKQFREQRKKQAKHATYIGTGAALAIIALTVAAIALVNYCSNAVVLRVGKQSVKQDLYTCVYYCNTMTSKEWKNYGFDVKKDPYEQVFTYAQGSEEYDSWGDFFQSTTNETLRFFYVMEDIARQGGYSYTDNVDKQVEEELAAIENEKNAATSFREYMLQTYGADVKKSVYKQYLRLYYASVEFYDAITQDKALFCRYLGVSDDVFESTYQNNRDSIDVVSFRYFALSDEKENEANLQALKTAKNEKEFQSLCNRLQNDKEYTEKDSSLYEDVALKTIAQLTDSRIVEGLCSDTAKPGDVFVEKGTVDGKGVNEVLYLVKAKAKNEKPYENSSVKMWEFSAMSFVLEDYSSEHYNVEEVEKGLSAFKQSIIVAA